MSSGLNELTPWLEKSWPTFRKQWFQMQIFTENMLISTKIKQICYSGPIDKNIIDLDNGLVLKSRHANIWVNIDIFHKHTYASFNF